MTEQLAIAGTATYGGEVYGGHLAANAANNHTVDWWRFDAFAEYKLTNNIELKISGLNLTNELYYDAIYQAAAQTSIRLRGSRPRRVSHGESEILRPDFAGPQPRSLGEASPGDVSIRSRACSPSRRERQRSTMALCGPPQDT